MKHRVSANPFRRALAAALCLPIFVTAALGQNTAPDAEFATLVQAVRSGDASDAQVEKMLRAAQENGRAFTANQAVKGYLRREMTAKGEMVRLAAETAAMAGDLRTAVNRYKNYLGAAADDKVSADAAAHMYELMIESLKTENDAYQYMMNADGKFRGSVNARKYDGWFFHQAMRKGQYNTAINHFLRVMADASPLEKKHWDDTSIRLVDEMLKDARENPARVLETAAKLESLVPHVTELAGRRDYFRLASLYL